MNITRISLALIFAGSSLFLTNCKKDAKDPDPTPVVTPAQSNTEKLTGKNFKMTAATVEPAILGVNDLYAQMDDCQKDDIVRFDTPNVYKEDEGVTKCDPNDPQTTVGTWVWNTNETILTTSIGGETLSYNVITNDGTTLKVNYTEEISNVKYTVTATFVKQ